MTSAKALVPPHFNNGTLEHVRKNMKNRAHLSTVLQRVVIERQHFDPQSAEHRAAYLVFMRTGKWVMHFYSQWPYQSVVTMVQEKLLKHFLENDATNKDAIMMLSQHNHGVAVNDATITKVA